MRHGATGSVVCTGRVRFWVEWNTREGFLLLILEVEVLDVVVSYVCVER